MNKFPKRDDEIYKEIESFQEYEFTQCVTYEMAIRNSNNIEKIEKLISFYTTNQQVIFNIVKDQKFYLSQQIPSKEFSTIISIIHDIDFVSYDYLETRFNFYQILQEVNLHKQKFEKRDDFFETLGETIERDVYTKITKLTKITNINPSEYFYFGESKIYTKFKRPKIKIDSYITKKTTLEININKPLNEILAYITNVKKDLEENKGILKAPIELLGESLKDAVPYKNHVKKTTAQKMADWFFIYDYYKIAKPNSKKSDEIIFGEIDLLLMEYYDIMEKDYYYSSETYKKTIMKNMKYLIDELGYKELITGVINKG